MEKRVLTLSLEPQPFGFDYRRSPFIELELPRAGFMRVRCHDADGKPTVLEGSWDLVAEKLKAFGYRIASPMARPSK